MSGVTARAQGAVLCNTIREHSAHRAAAPTCRLPPLPCILHCIPLPTQHLCIEFDFDTSLPAVSTWGLLSKSLRGEGALIQVLRAARSRPPQPPELAAATFPHPSTLASRSKDNRGLLEQVVLGLLPSRKEPTTPIRRGLPS